MSRSEGPPSLLPLELERVCFADRGRLILDTISLSLRRGGKTVFLGPNGAGKSVLMRVCHGLLEPTAGAIHWRGSLGRDAATVRRRQAMVFQKPVLLRRSTLANVTYALAVRGVGARERRTQALAALAQFGLSPLADRPARLLSGGEQQRLALARAWCLRPEVLFLDEPTASLDPAATRAVEDAVHAFHRAGTSIVMSTHDLGQARRLADDVVFIYSGRVLEHTPASAFFAMPATPPARAFLRGELTW